MERVMELRIQPEELRPVIEAVAAELLSRLPPCGERLAYSEKEAAALLGVSYSALRDERMRHRVNASVVGRKIRYTREDLLQYLSLRRWSDKHDA